jgi:hypothetical protein
MAHFLRPISCPSSGNIVSSAPDAQALEHVAAPRRACHLRDRRHNSWKRADCSRFRRASLMARAVSISLLGAGWTAGAFGARVRMGGFLLTKDDIKCEPFLLAARLYNRDWRKISWLAANIPGPVSKCSPAAETGPPATLANVQAQPESRKRHYGTYGASSDIIERTMPAISSVASSSDMGFGGGVFLAG